MFQENKDTGKILLGILSAILVLLFALVLILCWYFFDVRKNQTINQGVSPTTETSMEKSKDFLDLSNNDPEVGGVVEKVSRHMLLPAKNFTVATINDAPVLWKENPILFQYVKNGQKVLVYDSGMIIYDPVLDKIVDVVQFYSVRQELLSKQKNNI